MDRKQLADAIDAVQSHSELGNLVSRVLWPFFDELNAVNEHVRRRCDEAVKEARKECESLLALSKRIEELKQALASAYVPPSPAEEADEDDAGLRGEARRRTSSPPTTMATASRSVSPTACTGSVAPPLSCGS